GSWLGAASITTAGRPSMHISQQVEPEEETATSAHAISSDMSLAPTISRRLPADFPASVFRAETCGLLPPHTTVTSTPLSWLKLRDSSTGRLKFPGSLPPMVTRTFRAIGGISRFHSRQP